MKEANHYLGREQTYIKHYFLERYLEKVAYKIGSFSEDFVFVDGFSGPWKSENENYEDTSFKIAIAKLRKVRAGLNAKGKKFRIKCIFCERSEAAYQQLVRAVSDIEDIDIVTINGDFESQINNIVYEVGSRFCLTFIDPTGWKGYSLEKIRPLLAHKPGEVIINFMFDHINRFIEHPNKSVESGFDSLFGSRVWRNLKGESVGREQQLIDMYAQRIVTTGHYKYVTSTAIKKPKAERTCFHLIYGTRHPEGVLEFRKAEESSAKEQELVRSSARHLEKEKETGQTDLFGISNEPEDQGYLLEEIRQSNLASAENKILYLLRESGAMNFQRLSAEIQSIPLIWESDMKRMVLELRERNEIEIIGMTARERVPKKDNTIRASSYKPRSKSSKRNVGTEQSNGAVT